MKPETGKRRPESEEPEVHIIFAKSAFPLGGGRTAVEWWPVGSTTERAVAEAAVAGNRHARFETFPIAPENLGRSVTANEEQSPGGARAHQRTANTGAESREASGESGAMGLLSPAMHSAGVGVKASAGAGREARTGLPRTIPAACAQVGAARAVALVGISARAVCPAGSYCAVRGGSGHAE